MKTLREAIFQVLEEKKVPMKPKAVYKAIVLNNSFDFEGVKSPIASVAEQLRNFITEEDPEVGRVKMIGGNNAYFLTRFRDQIGFSNFDTSTESEAAQKEAIIYTEQDLHLLLSTYLSLKGVLAKTLIGDSLIASPDPDQKWIHGNVVGVKFLNPGSKGGRLLLKAAQPTGAMALSSYTVRREVHRESELRQAYFQALSNSSWANYPYLVVLELNEELHEETERLHQAFGVGVIELRNFLKGAPYRNTELFPARFRDLDYRSIDKLCKINLTFNNFIERCEKRLTADERFLEATETEIVRFCDGILMDREIRKYCLDKGIPLGNKK